MCSVSKASPFFCWISTRSCRKLKGQWSLTIHSYLVLLVFVRHFLTSLYKGYQKFVDPGVSPEFQAAAIRFGITMAPPGVYMRYYMVDALTVSVVFFVNCQWACCDHCQKKSDVPIILNGTRCIGSSFFCRNKTCHFRKLVNTDGSSSPAMRLCNSFWKRQVNCDQTSALKADFCAHINIRCSLHHCLTLFALEIKEKSFLKVIA